MLIEKNYSSVCTLLAAIVGSMSASISAFQSIVTSSFLCIISPSIDAGGLLFIVFPSVADGFLSVVSLSVGAANLLSTVSLLVDSGLLSAIF